MQMEDFMKQSISYLLVFFSLCLCVFIPQNSIAQNQEDISSRLILELSEKQEPLDLVDDGTYPYDDLPMLIAREASYRNARSSIGFNKLPVQFHVESRNLLLELERFINSMYLSYRTELNSDICTNYILSLLFDTELFDHYEYSFNGEDYRLFSDIDNYIEHRRTELENLKTKWESCLTEGIPELK